MGGGALSAGRAPQKLLQAEEKIMVLETDNIDFRAVFSSKAETEEHVGVSHVLGNLS